MESKMPQNLMNEQNKAFAEYNKTLSAAIKRNSEAIDYSRQKLLIAIARLKRERVITDLDRKLFFDWYADFILKFGPKHLKKTVESVRMGHQVDDHMSDLELERLEVTLKEIERKKALHIDAALTVKRNMSKNLKNSPN